jgi:penicillin-binding protein 1C
VTRRRLLLGALALAIAPWVAWTIAVQARFPIERLALAPATSVTVLDAAGGILREEATSAGGRTRWAPLDRIAPALVAATLAAEDRRFWFHAGVDWRSVVRAAWLDLRAGRFASGASTITMQLVKLTAPRSGRGPWQKLVQAVDAARLERSADKRTILGQYLNRAYYGHGAYGIEAAASFYFGKPASSLSLGEAALLAVLPRGPTITDPYRALDRTLARRRALLDRMVALGWARAEDRALAEAMPLGLRRDRPGFRAPHFVEHVLAATGTPHGRGGVIATTLDGPLQAQLEASLADHLGRVGGRHVTQAGLVVLRNADGAILAMIGSRAYLDAEHSGAVNVTTIRRRPGSTLKPFVYGLAFEAGDTPATLAFDVVLPGEAHQRYTTDVKQHGFARYREALAGSYNLAAIHTLARVGPRTLVERLRDAAVSTLDRPSYGVELAIGEAEVTLLELAGAFAAFGNAGRPVRPRAVVAFTPAGGAPIRAPELPTPAAMFDPRTAYLVYDVLSDPDARRPMFGSDAPMNLPFRVALKTGTTRAYTDNLAFGTTREYTVAAWAGNFDGKPMDGLMAMQGAAPLVRAAFVALAARFGEPTAPERPAGLVERDVCPLSGHVPGPACPARKRELFALGHEPDPHAPCALHARRCGRVVVLYPDEVRSWARAVQRPLAPPGCDDGRDDAQALRIVSPIDGARFSLDPFRPPEHQRPPLRATPAREGVQWTIDHRPADAFVPSPGDHVVSARIGHQASTVVIRYE